MVGNIRRNKSPAVPVQNGRWMTFPGTIKTFEVMVLIKVNGVFCLTGYDDYTGGGCR